LLLALALLAAGCAPQVAAGSWAGLAADDNGLIMANLDRVTRLNDAGTARWEFPTAADRNQTIQFYAHPALTEETVFIGGFNHKIYALDRDNGQTIWINETDARTQIIGGLAVAQGKVIVGMSAQGVIALNQRSGELVWRFSDTLHGVWATPLIVEGVVYVTSLDKNLYALDLDTGEELWRRSLEGAVAGTPAYEDGMLFVGSFAHRFFKIDAATGEIVATFDTQNWVWGGPALVDGVVYFGDLSGTLYALETGDLTPLWQRQVATEAIRATPLVVDDMLVVGSRDNRVYAVERENGLPVWTQEAGADVLSDAVLSPDGLVVVSTLDATRMLVAYNPADGGREVWRYPAATSSE
jgi:outer membrane protein assembly factor BamB